MQPKQAAITVDTLDDYIAFVFTEEKVKWLLDMIARAGFMRVYWYDYVAHTGLFRECGILSETVETLKRLPNHTEVAARQARELGLEFFVTYKPYEGGMHYTFPPGSEEDRNYGKLDRVGGRTVWVSDWVVEHPHLRVKRRMDDVPDDIHERIINRVEIDKNDNTPSGLRKEDIRLYVSRDNATYSPYTGEWTFTEETVDTVVLDYFGHQLNTDTHQTRRVTLANLGIGPQWKYVVVTAGQKAEQFKFIPMTMCNVYDDRGVRLPVTFATDSAERKPGILRRLPEENFVKYGFEFDEYGRAMGGSGVYYDTSFCALKLGIARGVNEYFSGALCEGYEEVRKYWLDQVRRILSYGVDGMEIRISNHANDTQDPFAYGFNEPILQRYRDREGSDTIGYDPAKIMKIRGEFFTQFLKDAAVEIHSAGAKAQAQVIAQYANGDIRALANRSFTGVWPDWEKWVREIVDAITFRDFLAHNYNPQFDRAIKPFARSLGREVWVPAYFTMSGCNVHDTYLRAVEADDDVTGVMFYESSPNYEEKAGRFEFKPEWADIIARFMQRNR